MLTTDTNNDLAGDIILAASGITSEPAQRQFELVAIALSAMLTATFSGPDVVFNTRPARFTGTRTGTFQAIIRIERFAIPQRTKRELIDAIRMVIKATVGQWRKLNPAAVRVSLLMGEDA